MAKQYRIQFDDIFLEQKSEQQVANAIMNMLTIPPFSLKWDYTVDYYIYRGDPIGIWLAHGGISKIEIFLSTVFREKVSIEDYEFGHLESFKLRLRLRKLAKSKERDRKLRPLMLV